MSIQQTDQENIEIPEDLDEDFESEFEFKGNKYIISKIGNIYRKLDQDVNDDQSQEPETVVDTIVEEQEEDLETQDDLTDSELKNTPEMEKNAIKNKKKGECDLVEKFTETDLEPYQETKETKPDGAFSMMERNISECMRKSGNKRSREECAKEVKKIMAKKEMPIIETEDTEDKDKEEEYENEDEDKDKDKKESKDKKEDKKDKKDTVEICPKELDMLKEKAKKLDKLEKDFEDLEKDAESNEKELTEFKADFLKFKGKIEAEEAKKKEIERQIIIKKLSNDFELPEEELKDDTIEELIKLDKRFGMALKQDSENIDEDIDEDEDMTADAIHDKYFIKV